MINDQLKFSNPALIQLHIKVFLPTLNFSSASFKMTGTLLYLGHI